MNTDLTWSMHVQDDRIFAGEISGLPKNAVLCFSMVAPVRAVAGCSKLLGSGAIQRYRFPLKVLVNFRLGLPMNGLKYSTIAGYPKDHI